MSPTRRDDPPAIRIEVENEWAWCGDRRLQLAPRVFAVLRYLVDRRGRLVTKEELLTAVWRDAVVSDAALASGIRDVRKALEDSSATPRYVQTVHRRGFRFIGPVAEPTAPVATVDATARKVGPRDDPSARVPRDVASLLVGREAELSRLHARLERALGGQRQLVFVTGEPGIGKSALVEAFCADAGKVNALRVGWGQCVEQYGAGEAYLPVLEALGRLGRAAGGERLVQVLKQHAPTWLEHLPALLSDDEIESSRCSAARTGQRARGCCASWSKRWTTSRATRRSCWYWRIFTGAIRPPSSCSACSRAGGTVAPAGARHVPARRRGRRRPSVAVDQARATAARSL